jgi:hypothetical protein
MEGYKVLYTDTVCIGTHTAQGNQEVTHKNRRLVIIRVLFVHSMRTITGIMLVSLFLMLMLLQRHNHSKVSAWCDTYDLY